MRKLNIIYGLLLMVFIVASCSNSNPNRRTDTHTSGVARIVVDECLAPIIQQQVDVFEGTYTSAMIIPVYTSDREAYRLLMEDSIRLLIGTRELTRAEKKEIKDRKQRMLSQKLAIDGVALITNKNNTDTLISIETIKRIMKGEVTSWKDLNPESKLGDIKVVFDSPNSSTARYIADSITMNAPFGGNVGAIGADTTVSIDLYSETANQQVIKYVESDKNALGVVGLNWISNPKDTTGLSFTSRVNVMSISNEKNGEPGKYYKPYAAYLALKWYPLRRDVYIIITDARGGLPSGFVNFAAGEIGQRIINKSGLLPATVPTRLVRIQSSADE